ncbi:Late competence protein ComEC, DNA transport [Clostridiaceae bacterium JG1575]|nr:Late competence protein ComEC, DNA transport [Clostridiaceae bacterium JG1575]
MLHFRIFLARLWARWREQGRINKAFVLSLFLLFLVSLSFLFIPPDTYRLLLSGNRSVLENRATLTRRDPFKIHILDVGQGDATLLSQGTHHILIDAGPPEAEESLRAYLKALGIESLDLLILTHPHDDHLAAAPGLLRDLQVAQLMVPHQHSKNPLLQESIVMAQARGVPICSPLQGDVLHWGDVTLTCLHPQPIQYLNENNQSCVWHLRYRKFRALFLADWETSAPFPLPEEPLTFLRTGHHGSDTSLTQELALRLSPKVAVISCGKDNPYGHPSPKVLEALEDVHALIYRTDLEGTKVFSTDGHTLHWVH